MTMKNGFDPNFLFGGAICSSQAEGAYDEGGKGLDTQDLRYFDPSWTRISVVMDKTGPKVCELWRSSLQKDWREYSPRDT